MTFKRDDHVGTLQVAVYDTSPVRVRQGVSYLRAISHHRLEWKTVRGMTDDRVLPFTYSIAMKVRPSASPISVHGANVRMVEMRKGLRFAHESLAGGGVLESTRMQHLQGDVPDERRVVRSIDRTHSTSTDCLENAVTSYRLASHRNQIFLAPAVMPTTRRSDEQHGWMCSGSIPLPPLTAHRGSSIGCVTMRRGARRFHTRRRGCLPARSSQYVRSRFGLGIDVTQAYYTRVLFGGDERTALDWRLLSGAERSLAALLHGLAVH